MQARPALLAVVAAGVHRGGERLGVPEDAREQRHRDGRQHAHGTARARGGARPAAGLSAVGGPELGGELRHEPQGDAQDHAQLVRGETEARERHEQALDGVREVERHGREGDEAHAAHHDGHARAHEQAGAHASLGDAQGSQLREHAPALPREEVEHRDQRDEHQKRRQRAQRAARGNARDGVQAGDEGRQRPDGREAARREGAAQEGEAGKELRARVEQVQGTLPRVVAAEGERPAHSAHPPAAARRARSSANVSTE